MYEIIAKFNEFNSKIHAAFFYKYKFKYNLHYVYVDDSFI